MTKLLKFVILLLVIAIPMSVFAQELSEEDQANIEKALAALEAASDYPSYAVEQTAVNGSTVTMTANGEVLLSQDSSEVNTTSYTLTNGETPNLSGTASVIGTRNENETETTYLMEAELRLVDGEIYVNASYLTPDPELPALPEGWTAITREDVATYPGLESLGMDKIFTVAEEGGPMPFVENFEAFAEVVRSSAIVVAVEPQTLEDGREVENITILLGSEGLGGLLMMEESQATDPITQALVENLTEDSSGLLTVSIDADGNLAQVLLAAAITTSEIDMATVMEDAPEGSVAVFNVTISSLVTISGIGETYPAAEVPAE